MEAQEPTIGSYQLTVWYENLIETYWYNSEKEACRKVDKISQTYEVEAYTIGKITQYKVED